MTSKLVLMLVASFFYLSTAHAQDTLESKEKPPLFISSRIGINTLNEFNLQFEKPVNDKLGLHLYLGYNYGSGLFGGDGLFCDHIDARVLTARQGPVIRPGISLYGNKPGYPFSIWHLLTEFRFNWVNNMVIYPNCYGGSSEGLNIPREFDWTNTSVGFMIYHDRRRRSDQGSNLYFGFGLRLRNAFLDYNQAKYEDLPFLVTPPKDERFVDPGFQIDIGFRLGMRKRHRRDLPNKPTKANESNQHP